MRLQKPQTGKITDECDHICSYQYLSHMEMWNGRLLQVKQLGEMIRLEKK